MSTIRPSKPLPYFIIPKDEANMRIKNFQEFRLPELNRLAGGEDTRSVWYDIQYLELLQKELYYLNADGLRVYFGAYPDDHPDYPRQTCLLFVPTFYNENREHEDIIIEDEAGFMLRPSTPFPKPFNYGSPCPKACSGHLSKYPY